MNETDGEIALIEICIDFASTILRGSGPQSLFYVLRLSEKMLAGKKSLRLGPIFKPNTDSTTKMLSKSLED